MKKLTNFLGSLTLIGVVVLSGCNSNYRTLHENKGTETIRVHEGDTYIRFARNLKREYPEIERINTQDVYMYLEELNGNKELKAGEGVKLPVY